MHNAPVPADFIPNLIDELQRSAMKTTFTFSRDEVFALLAYVPGGKPAPKFATCTYCNGSGLQNGHGDLQRACLRCNGAGKVRVNQ